MTLVVAIDTASDTLSVALRTRDGRIAARRHDTPRDHARVLLPLLDEGLREVGGTADRVTEVRLVDGPGSFTGLRVGASVAKAIAFRSRSVLRVTSGMLLPVLALPMSECPGEAVVLQSALRGEWYRARYRVGPGKIVARVESPVVVVGADLFAGAPPKWVLGAGTSEERDVMAQAPEEWRARWIPDRGRLPGALALLALDEWEGDARWAEADRRIWEPAYGRPAEAVNRWQVAHGRPLPSRSPRPR